MKTIIDFANKVKSLVDGRMSNIANVETSPSTHPYAVGKQLIFNGLLCKATSAIAVGDTLAVGTNLALADNVVEQIYSLNQGLTNSLNEIADMNNVLGAKNLLPNNATNQTVNGVTFTVNDDGSITANGTASANTGFTIALDIDARGMILSGCPAGGSRSTYSLQYTNYVDESFADEGNGITIPLSTNTGLWRVAIWITAQSIVNNLVFKPMIRPASITDDTYVPYSMTNREMTPYVQSISNPNLLDNAWFTVNQRGQSSFPSVNYAYWMDRWKLLGKNSETIGRTITLDDGISVSAGTGSEPGDIVCQVLEKERFQFEKVYTLSVMLDDGKVYSVSGILPTPDGTYKIPIFTVVSGKILIRVTEELNKNIGVIASAETDNISFKIKAMKLELGTVSTLAMDTAPNYQQELAKCMRYFVRLHHESIGTGIIDAANACACVVPVPVPMRAMPSLTLNGSIGVGIDDGTFGSITSITSWNDNGVTCVGFSGSGVTHAAGSAIRLYLINNNSLDISADL